MGIRTAIVVLFVMVFGAGSANALEMTATSSTSESDVKVELPSEPRWLIEGDMQAHSVAGDASPWVGIGASVRIFDSYHFGFRGFVPLSKTVDESTYSIQSFARARIYRGRSTDFLFEGNYSVNFYNFLPFPSFGGSVGAINHFSPGLDIGVLGGIEVAHVVLDSVGLEQVNNLVVYPKIALVVDFGL